MSRVLPASPNLEHLKKEAKAMLRAAVRGDSIALDRFRAVGAFSAANLPKLADAQHLLAKEYGFANWSSLKDEVLILSSDADPAAGLSAALRAKDVKGVYAILSRHPRLKTKIDQPLPNASFGGIALTMAASANSREIVDLLLDAGADINAKTDWWAGGFSALDLAEPGLAQFLIERGAKIVAYAAARLGMFDKLQQILDADPVSVHVRGGDGQTPLHVAANVEIAALLLERGADIDALDVDHESTPAMYHVRERTNVTRYLMSRGCKTDILMAAAVGNLDLVREFLDRDPEAIRTTVSPAYFPMRDPRAGGTIYIWTFGGNKSPHAIAREFGHVDIFNFLMQRTPDSLALAISAELGDESSVDSLLTRQPQLVNALNEDERHKLVTAAERNDERAVRLMLRAGWPVATRRGSETTALHWAGFHGNAGMMREILRYNPPLDVVEATFKGTPLSWTLHGSEYGWHKQTGDYAASVALLLDAGATLPPIEKIVASEAVTALLRQRGIDV